MSGLSENEIAELGCTYAALILHDDKIQITVLKKSQKKKDLSLIFSRFFFSLFEMIRPTRSQPSWKHPKLLSNLSTQLCLPRFWELRILTISFSLLDLPAQLLPQLPQSKLPRKRRMRRRTQEKEERRKRRRRKNPRRKKKQVWKNQKSFFFGFYWRIVFFSAPLRRYGSQFVRLKQSVQTKHLSKALIFHYLVFFVFSCQSFFPRPLFFSFSDLERNQKKTRQSECYCFVELLSSNQINQKTKRVDCSFFLCHTKNPRNGLFRK